MRILKNNALILASYFEGFQNPPSFSFSSIENFWRLPSPILKPKRCPQSLKLLKFESENKNSQGLRVLMIAIHGF